MILRVARHTSDLTKITRFYHEILELEILGSFTDHAGYDGVFLGHQNNGWHLEFTTSDEMPKHDPDEDDLLVFYVKTPEEKTNLENRLIQSGFNPITAKNPYWNENGSTFTDPDGFRIVLSVI
jgi:catechol 2,3-dioxygenase-like lactoylglutathione lyase family enzyme